MISFLLDTSTSKVVIAIYKDKKKLYSNMIVNHEDLSTKIWLEIDKAFKMSGIDKKDVDIIYSVNGPGSFTGTRIGVTICKTYGWAFKIKVVPISSLELLATTVHKSKYIASLIDARRGYVYASLYDSNLKPIIDDCYIKLSDFKEKLVNLDVSYVSYDSFDFEVKTPSINIEKIIRKHCNDKGIIAHKLVPNYIKKTQAEEELKEV